MFELSYAFAGAFVGILIGLTGVGGGALMTPILLVVFDVQPLNAIATDLWFAAITKIVGARVHHYNGFVDWLVVKRLWLGSLVIALLTIVAISFGVGLDKLGWLTKAVGVLVLITAVGLLAAPKLFLYAREQRVVYPYRFKAVQPALTVASGAVLGACVTLTSVGAGALGSLMLLYLYPLRMTPHRLVATDIVHAIPLALIGGIGYLFMGVVDWWILGSLLIGSIPAVLLASVFAKKIAGRWLQIVMAIVLAISGCKVLA